MLCLRYCSWAFTQIIKLVCDSWNRGIWI